MACGGREEGTDRLVQFVGCNQYDFIACALCNEVKEATCHCDECLINFCDGCASVHEKLPGKGSHLVEKGVCSYDMEFELCENDGQKMSFFCRTCMVRVCPECELNKNKHGMHSMTTVSQHIGHEKEKLLDRLDEVTTKTESISYLLNDYKSMALQIELKWLERKELIRQEFISLHETIHDCEEKLLADMEQELQASLHRLKKLEEDHKSLQAATCQLSDDCISAVQSLPRQDFLNSYAEFVDSMNDLEHKVGSVPSADDHTPAFLKLPFSLHKEKVHLHNCLQIETFFCHRLKAKKYQMFVPLKHLNEELTIDSLIDIPEHIPPSTSVGFQVEIFRGTKKKQKAVWGDRWTVLKATDQIINGSFGVKLWMGQMYVLKIQPIFTCTTHQGDQTVEGQTVTVLVVTAL